MVQGPTGGAEGADDIASYRHGRVPREVRLRQVVDLGARLFAERGYSAASMDELARRAGVSKPVVYDLVGSKEELFRLLMVRTADDLAARVTEAVHAAADPYERLVAGARAWFGFIADHRAIWGAFLAGEDTPVGDEIRRIRRRQADVVAALLAEDAGELGAPLPPTTLQAVATLVNGGFEALGVWWADHPEVSADELAELCARALYPGLRSFADDPLAGWDQAGATAAP